MFFRMKAVFLIICMGFGLISMQAVAGPLQHMDDPKQAIVVQGNTGRFMIRLTSNPTTGYSWFWVNDGSLQGVTPVQHVYLPPNSHLIGAPGIEEWTFQIATEWRDVPQVLHVKMQYLRPWGQEAKEPLMFTVVYMPPSSESVQNTVTKG